MQPGTQFMLEAFQNAKNLKYQIAKKVLEQGFIQYKGKTMRFQYFQLGPMPQDGYRLVFGLHGGGGCPFEFNQQQWNNHQHLYDNELPPGTIWFVPRSPEDVPDMWWKDYIPHMLTSIIQYFSALNMIDMNQIFLTGYSAGGDGLYHIAGIMADYLAGAAMMAGHPNEALCQNLRNIVFSIQVGEEDTAYDRANWAKVYINRLKQLKRQYGGFVQYSQIHSGMGHWMEKKDTRMFKKFFNAVRDPYPDFIMFRQHPRFLRKRFYYLKFQKQHQGLICVSRQDNSFWIKSEQKIPIKILVHQNMVDFDQEIIVNYNGFTTNMKVNLSNRKNIIMETAKESLDPDFIFEAQLTCVPKTNIPKDWETFRPFQMQNKPSSRQKLNILQNIVCQNAQIYCKLNTNAKDVIEQVHQTRRLHDNQQYDDDENICEDLCTKCQIY